MLFRLFSLAQRHTLRDRACLIRTFHPDLTTLKLQVLDLLGVPANAYRSHGLQSNFAGNHACNVRNVGSEYTRESSAIRPRSTVLVSNVG
jgi:hypothetical protein